MTDAERDAFRQAFTEEHWVQWVAQGFATILLRDARQRRVLGFLGRTLDALRAELLRDPAFHRTTRGLYRFVLLPEDARPV